MSGGGGGCLLTLKLMIIFYCEYVNQEYCDVNQVIFSYFYAHSYE